MSVLRHEVSFRRILQDLQIPVASAKTLRQSRMSAERAGPEMGGAFFRFRRDVF